MFIKVFLIFIIKMNLLNIKNNFKVFQNQVNCFSDWCRAEIWQFFPAVQYNNWIIKINIKYKIEEKIKTCHVYSLPLSFISFFHLIKDGPAALVTKNFNAVVFSKVNNHTRFMYLLFIKLFHLTLNLWFMLPFKKTLLRIQNHSRCDERHVALNYMPFWNPGSASCVMDFWKVSWHLFLPLLLINSIYEILWKFSNEFTVN